MMGYAFIYVHSCAGLIDSQRQSGGGGGSRNRTLKNKGICKYIYYSRL